MKNKIKNWIYNTAVKVIAKRIVHSENRLTPEYLLSKGWITERDEVRDKTFYVEPNIKKRDKISIDFEKHSYRLWHGPDRTFIACESSVEWFEIYYLMAHSDNGRYKLAGI
ncbi:MAG: hypothetical protein K0S44_244 [Bacteroidetes bacterium]|jgi:hypothetical protein|nr:hypothetical protein [Bacteroidota bacterium]